MILDADLSPYLPQLAAHICHSAHSLPSMMILDADLLMDLLPSVPQLAAHICHSAHSLPSVMILDADLLP